MLLSACSARRAVAGVVGTGAIAGAMLVGAIPSAIADPQPEPPNCTAADLAGVHAGVSAATSAYLFTHPDVNWFFTSLEGQHRADLRDDVQAYLDANSQVKAELTAIRQPLVDIKNRCGAAPAQPFRKRRAGWVGQHAQGGAGRTVLMVDVDDPDVRTSAPLVVVEAPELVE